MRVLLSAYACRPNAGSEPGCGWNWATHLAARGIEVHVLVAKRNQEAIETSIRNHPIANLHFTYVPVSYGRAKNIEALHYVLWQLAALAAARELSNTFHFQLIHHVTYASVHVPSPLWRLGVPIIFGPVGGGQTAPPTMLSYFGADRSRERLRSLVTRALRLSAFHKRWLRRMSFILAANVDTLKLVRTMGCQRTSLMCDSAISDDYYAENPRHFEEQGRTFKLLWVGRMLTRKALRLALDAVKEAQSDATLTIAGDGSDPGTVRQMIRDRNLQKRVFWKGTRLTWAELRMAYAEHDAMLFTSLRDSFGSQILEAMAMGLPIITLDLHGAHDWVPTDASLKVGIGRPEETVRGLAAAIDQYASLSAATRNRMSLAAWNFAKANTWSARAEFCDQLYQRILSGGTALENTADHKVSVLVT